MKQPWWKIWASYLVELKVEESTSDYNSILDLLLVKGRYQLCTDKAIYSYADKYDNFSKAFDQLKLPADGASVLLLGFGLGSIPYMLEKVYGKKYSYVAVEIDEEVVYLASKYVLDDLQSDIQIHTMDGVNFMNLNTSRFDMICMDIFEDDFIPGVFETDDFLLAMKEGLTDQGLLIYNRLAFNPDIENKTRRFFQTAFNRVFPKSRALKILGNWLLVNDESKLINQKKN